MPNIEIAGKGVAGLADPGDGAGGTSTLLGRKSVLMGIAASMGFAIANAAQPSAAAAAEAVTYAPMWSPYTAYASGQQVISPNNDVVSAQVAHQSSAVYTSDALNWTLSSTYVQRLSAYPLGTAENPVTDPAAPRPSGIPVVYWITASAPTNATYGDVISLPSSDVPATQIRSGVETAPALNISDTTATGQQQISLSDTATHDAAQLQISHASAVSACYGINLINRPGARTGLVVQQHSGFEPAIWLENTDNAATIRINNTHNFRNNPRGPATSRGDFWELMTESVVKLRLRQDYVFEALGSTVPTFYTASPSAKGLSVETAAGVETAALEVIKKGTGAGLGVNVTNAGTGAGITVLQTGAGNALNISTQGASNAVTVSQGVGSAKFWTMVISSQAFGETINTSSNDGVNLNVVKNGTAAGTVLAMTNKGTGASVIVRNAAGERMQITSAGLLKWSAAANQQTSVGPAGKASALPAKPVKYLKVVDSAGTIYVVPCYAAS